MITKVGRPETTGLGKSHKVECATCGNHNRKSLAQLRDHGPDLCGKCYAADGAIRFMTCQDNAIWAITPEGREALEVEALAVAGRTLERKELAARRSLFPQLRCECCGKPQTSDHSVKLIELYIRSTGSYGGGELRFSHSYATDQAEREGVFIGCDGGCTGDTFSPMRKRGKTVKAEAEECPF